MDNIDIHSVAIVKTAKKIAAKVQQIFRLYNIFSEIYVIFNI